MKILVFIDLDITIRHFIKTGAFSELEKRHDLVYIFNKDKTSEKKGVHTDPVTLGLRNIQFTTVPRSRTGAWFPLYMATVLRQQRGLPNYKARKADATRQSSRGFIFKSLLRGIPGIYQLYRHRVISRLGIDPSVEALIHSERPDLIVHPSTLNGYYINELMQASQKFGIPFILLMNSWDNPSAKAVCTGLPDKLIVWGEQSRQHAMAYMRMPCDRIEVFGAAQFQVYRNPPPYSRDELCRFFGVPKDKKIILYAGAGSGRHETEYLKTLDSAVQNGTLADCHILYRPHPWRGGLGEGEEDFFARSWSSVSMDPHMEEYYKSEVANPTGRVCMIDYSVSNMLLTLADAVISPLSTMLVEAMTLGKPILVFFPREYHDMELSTDEVHFAELLAVPDVNVSLNSNEFIAAVGRLKGQIGDSGVAERLRTSSRFFHVLDGPTYSERLDHLVASLFAKKHRGSVSI